jgi:UPF0755 protein
MARLFFVLLVVAIGAAAGVGWYVWRDLHTPVAPPAPEILIAVQPGASFRSVAEQLHRAGLVRWPLAFAVWARYRGLDRTVRSGQYRLSTPHSPVELLERLQSPAPELHWVTIPEGYGARQIAEELERAGFGGRDAFQCVMQDPRFLRSLDLPASGVEGYLFPDTYAFARAMTPEDILRAMVARFRESSAALTEARIAAGLTEAEMVTLASLVEKETGRPEERSLIAGVFQNRLRRGMLLQCDPTVVYALGDAYTGRLTRTDLTYPSPYNTYRHAGLPPGPIASPGLAALEAAVRPADTKALYFVSRNDGSHEFSRTLAQHNRAVARYRRLRRGSGRN